MTHSVLLLAEDVLRGICVVIATLGSIRFLLFAGLAVAYCVVTRRAKPEHPDDSYRPLVTVLVPAYNEERSIVHTVESVLASDHRRLEIVIVDDGSRDRTAEVVRERFGDDPRVRLFSRARAGKASALNRGLREARGEVVVTIDADTVVSSETIGRLARWFSEPRVGAVAGNLKVGNRVNIVTRCQALEYITAQGISRRAFALLNCMLIVPGPIGAWRQELLDRLGGFPTETVVEDLDLTLRARKSGYWILFDETARAWTEAPDTINGLYRQRRRWMFGTLQCIWKHRDALLRPRYGTLGLVGLPNMWIGGLIALMLPMADLMFASSGVVAVTNGSAFSAITVKRVLAAYVTVLLADWTTAGFGLLLEGREQWSLLVWTLPQRFYFRQVMHFALVRSLATFVLGRTIGWEGIERSARARPLEEV